MAPANRKMLIEWIENFKAQNKSDELGVLDFKNAILWRLKDENLFPIVVPPTSIWHPDFVLNRKKWLQEHDQIIEQAARDTKIRINSPKRGLP